ncbi:MAG: gamma carbonic anhydrase family protein [Gammaproteobacteria bacterium]|nr:gamma carbonic anhydrase family protein [Gammaproteobacteria bacterium]
MLKAFEELMPTVAGSAYVDETAVVIGDVVIGEDSSVWPITAIRGDVNIIRIGNSTNIQDGSVLHGSHASEFNPNGAELHIGDQVTVGHKVLLHGCRIGNLCLIGMGSIVMDNAIVGDQVIVGSGSLVTPGKELESGYMYLGSPARKVRALTEREKESLAYTANYYVSLKNKYKTPV